MAYITVDQANAVIATNRPDLEAAANNLELTHLEFASDYLDSLNWVGYRSEASQVNAWPRSYVPIDKYNNSLGYRDNSVIPKEIMLIVSELALRFLSNPGITGDAAPGLAVTGVTLPDTNPEVLGQYLSGRIKNFLRGGGGLYRVN